MKNIKQLLTGNNWLIFLTVLYYTTAYAAEYKRISLDEYIDKMKAGWIGQIVGVSLGAPTEFRWQDQIIPENKMPQWKPEMINDAFGQDDLYVEMTFLRTLEEYGLGVSIRQAGIDFANTGYPLWCANAAGRNNLRKGIASPDSSHPAFNKCPNDIDYQIEADYSGLIAPGIMQAPIDLGEKFGRLMNYGDGMYAGQFVGAMYATAFFENDPVRIAQIALAAIPEQSQYAEMVRDMIKWYRENPDNWEKTWNLCEEKYRKNPEYQKASNGGIDCKINGAYVLMGFLYGNRDPEKTAVIACRCGQDSDCNPSTAAGVLFTTIGYSKLPQKFKTGLDETKKFSHTPYTFPELIKVCEKLARQVIVKYGGKIVKNDKGEEEFLIPVNGPKPSKLELSWAPGPIANSKFTSEEMSKIKFAPGVSLNQAIEKFAPGWTVSYCGSDMNPGLRSEWQGRKNVLVTHPLDKDTGCIISKTVDIPAGKKTYLKLTVGNDPQGDFDLIVKVNGNEIFRNIIGPKTTTNHWRTESIALSKYAGKQVKIELINQPNGWSYEAAYWGEISIVSE